MSRLNQLKNQDDLHVLKFSEQQLVKGKGANNGNKKGWKKNGCPPPFEEDDN